MKEDNLDIFEVQGLVLFGAMAMGLIMSAVVWISEGCPQGFTDLDSMILITQLICWGVIIFVPLVIISLKRFKVVRRE